MRAQELYSWLAGLYPATFRERYRQAIERQFSDEYRDASTRGERISLWLGALGDLAWSVPAEAARELAQDLNYTVRVYRKRSLSALLAIAALALSIGASTGVFSVLNALLLRNLPFRAPEQLVELRFLARYALERPRCLSRVGPPKPIPRRCRGVLRLRDEPCDPARRCSRQNGRDLS